MRINLTNSISHLPLFDAADDKKAAAAKERDAIEVTTPKPEAKEEEEKVEEKEEDKEEVKEEEGKEEEKVEAKEEEIDDLKDEKKEAKTQAEKDRIQRRIDRLTKERSDLKTENENLKRQLAAKPDDEKALTEDEVERRAEIKAEEKRLQRQFADDCDKLASEAKKIDKDFDKKVGLMAEEVGNIPSQMIGILADLPNGGAVLSHLTNDLDAAEEVYKMSPARMALKLAKLSDKLIEEAKPKRAISKVPPPNEPLGGKGNTPEVLSDKLSDQEWIRIRNREVAEKNAAKQNAMRH